MNPGSANINSVNPTKRAGTGGMGRLLRVFKMKKWGTPARIVAATVVVVLLIIAYRAFGSTNGGQPKPVYSFGHVEKGHIEVRVSGTATVQAFKKQNVTAKTGGTVAEVLFQEGDRVEAGQALIRMTNDTLANQVEQARISLRLEQQSLAQMLDMPVEKALGVSPSSQYTVTAPASGRLVNMKLSAGARVTKGTSIGTIVDERSVLMVVLATTPEAASIHPGDKATIRLDNFSGTFDGKVISVAATGAAGDNTMYHRVEIAVDNPGLLKAGLAGSADIALGNGGVVSRLGQLEWRSQRDVRVSVSGSVFKIRATDGQVVRAGDPIVNIEGDDLAIQIESQQLKIKRTALDLESKLQQLNDLTVRAEMDGVVSYRNVEVGDTLDTGGARSGTSGSNVLATILDMTKASLVLSVDEVDVPNLSIGQKASVTLDALPGQVFEGVVSRIAAEGTPKSGLSSFDITVEIPNPASAIRAGMTASVDIVTAAKDDALLVPAEAVTQAGGRSFVRVVADGKQPEAREVKVGLKSDYTVEILEGLSEGERIVVAAFDPNAQQGRGMMIPMMGPGVRVQQVRPAQSSTQRQTNRR
ncbi:MAG: efflux RND transporter periplasmic adaptor subunit [Firmicutes bacterium]|nr:efflux RND transporter periplasmic adaptor subunit [Bacillota bacterium]